MRCPYQDWYCPYRIVDKDKNGKLVLKCPGGHAHDCKGKIEKEAGTQSKP